MNEITDFEAMTLAELIDWRTSKRAEERAVKAALNESNVVYRRKVFESHLAEAVRQVKRFADELGVPPERIARVWLKDPQPGRQRQASLFLFGNTKGSPDA